jgi:hypothetical protein
MGISGGPNILGDENLVFIYDIADTENCYLGEPTTNLASFNIASSAFNTDTPGNLTQTANSSEATFKGRLSRKMVVGSGYWNAYVYGYNTGISSTNFAVSYKIKTSDNSHPNTVVGGGYIYGSAGSFFPSPTFTSIGDGWYLATMLYSGTSMTLNSLTGMNGNGPKTFYIVDYQAEAKSNSTPYAGVSGTRSISGSLFDISPNRNLITLTNMSYINGQPSFDGTDDYINLLTNIQSGFTAATYEFVCYPTSIPGTGAYGQLYIQETSTWIALYNPSGTPAFGIDLNNGAGWFDNNGGFNTGARTTSTITANKFYHLVFSWSSSTVSVYLNGSLQSTVSTLQAANGRQNVSTL